MPTALGNSVDGSRILDGSKMQLESLELAGCTLDRFICTDNSRPSFLEITGIAAQRSPTCSGLNAGDYRNLAGLLNHPNLSQLKILNKVPLPSEIMEHFAHLKTLGLDADLIFFDPEASFLVTPEVIRYKNKISPYMYQPMTGILKQTYVRGQLVYANGELVGQPKGQLLLSPEFNEF